MSKILFVINPAGHGGTGLKVWEEFKTLWPEQIDPKDFIITERPGHAKEIAASAKGYDIIAAVGGDGTVGDILSGIMYSNNPARLAIIPAGTGNDIARNVGILTIEDAIAAIKAENIKAYDLIQIDSQVNGQKTRKYSFLMAAVGFSSIPMIKPWMKRLLGAKGAYYLATLLQIFIYHPPQMTVKIDEQVYKDNYLLVLVGNVERTAGGSMCLAPGASINDGLLNVTIIPPRSRFGMLTKLFPKIASGKHVNEPGIIYLPAGKIEVESEPPAIVELDGDLFGTSPVTITVCPGAFKVLSPDQS